MTKKYTPENFMVNPVDEKPLLEYIESKVNQSLQPSESIKIDIGAIACDNCEVSQDCIYEIANKLWVGDKPQFCFHIPVRIKTKMDGGTSHSMFPSFYFPMTFDDLKKYTLPEVSLKEFMGGRYDYNPRISQNMRAFMKVINETFIDTENGN